MLKLLKSVMLLRHPLVVRNYLSVPQGDYAICIIGNMGFMSNNDDRHASLIQGLKGFHNFAARLAVQSAGRLISEDQSGSVNQGARDSDTLLLTS